MQHGNLAVYQLILMGVFLIAPLQIPASEGDGHSPCSVRSASEQVVILICPAGLDNQALKMAGESACSDTLAEVPVCNAWMWDSEESAPRKAPRKDADLDKEKVRNAIAIWIHDASRLVLLGKRD